MLRMYECGWCQTRQVKDDGSVRLVPNQRTHAYQLRGQCYKNCRSYLETPFTPQMRPMRRNKDGDWYELHWHDRDTSKPELDRVVPPIMWH